MAALTVVAYHVDVLPFGQCGVDIFFVISGFIMSYVALGEGRGFLPKHLVRILPLYWMSTLGVYLVATSRPHWLNTTTTGAVYLLKSLLFKIQPDLNSWRGAAATLIVIAVVCVVRIVCHVLVERPMLARLNRQFGRLRTPLVGPA
ncbi:acyltransferase family protein [Paraburkholderia sediminicola]|uniref:acyltransferase family protein n=1 Tax=Paraburkholderia sediminicola TaxID=458836 RepID=UPI0038B777FB